jgi:hypothetical protein
VNVPLFSILATAELIGVRGVGEVPPEGSLGDR